MIALLNSHSNAEVVTKVDFKTPPIGLAYIASVLRENGFKVRIIEF
ncbi:hypothetical protein [Archaeoglobus sp.]